ncbi:MAG: hypothetical protein QE265_02455 [Rhodoferax sp.]|nr:hypothetical protein [Rhodoferax sp.]
MKAAASRIKRLEADMQVIRAHSAQSRPPADGRLWATPQTGLDQHLVAATGRTGGAGWA